MCIRDRAKAYRQSRQSNAAGPGRSIDAQSRAALSMEEAQANLTLMCIDTTFADACDRMRAHERGLVNWKHIDRTVLSLISACMVRSEGTCLSASKDRQDHILWFCRRTPMACS